jgi:hypothetical protein
VERARVLVVVAVVLAAVGTGCGAQTVSAPPSTTRAGPALPAPAKDEGPLPPHLSRAPELFVRDGDEIVPAPAGDHEVARRYPGLEPKGPVVDGHRLTILAAKARYRVGEEIRVIHVHEVLDLDKSVYPMGPKPVRGEHVDGRLVTPAVLADPAPLVPTTYDGRVLSGPAVDYNWEITRHRFQAPGRHSIQWRVGVHVSNLLIVEIVP